MISAKKKSNDYINNDNSMSSSEGNLRVDLRKQVYYKEMPDVIVRLSDKMPIQAQILDISSNGLGLYHPSFDSSLTGQQVEIVFGERKTYTLKGTVNTFDTVQFRGGPLARLGISFESKSSSVVNRPKRFKCSKKLPVLAYGEHPFRYNHKLLFNVSDFSSNGMTLVGSIKENLLLPGAVLLLNVMLPAVGEFEALVELTSIRSLVVNGESQFQVGAVFISPKPELLKAISSYLISDLTTCANISDLKENGFLVPPLVSSAVFSYVSSEEEWHQVLKLRLRAAQKAGRWIGETDHTKLTDNFDKYSRHIICKVENKIVASSRMVFNNSIIDRVEHGKIFDVPQALWDGGFVEVSRLNTDPDYRGSDLFLGFLQHGARIAGQQNLRYVLLNCEDSLVPIYQRYGALPLGVKFTTEIMQNKTLNLMMADLKNLYVGNGIGAAGWYLVWREVYEFLKSSGFVRPSMSQKFKTKVLENIGDLYFWFYNNKNTKDSMNKRKSILESFRENEAE